MGSYIDFINSMLGLREQKLKEEQLQAESERANIAAITESISSLGSSVGSAIGAYNKGKAMTAENTMYNQMSEQAFGAPPRAQAVKPVETAPMTATSGPPQATDVSPMSTATTYELDPAMQRQADAKAATMPGFYTGGKAEFDMRMKIDDSAASRLRTAMAQKKIDDDLAFKKSKFLVEQARKDTTARDKKFDAGFKNTKSYLSEMKVFDDGISNAKTPLEYDQAVTSKLALNQAAIDYGMKVDPISPESIPPFESEQQKLARESQELEVEKARKQVQAAQEAPLGIVDRTRAFLGLGTEPGAMGVKPPATSKDTAIAEAQKKYETQQATLREMQPRAGVSAVGPSTVSQAAPATGAVASSGTASGGMQTISSQEASAQAGKPIQPGTILTDKYGNKIRVR